MKGLWLALVRRGEGVPQKDLARRAMISPSYLCEIERGRKTAGDELQRRISGALGVPRELLFR